MAQQRRSLVCGANGAGEGWGGVAPAGASPRVSQRRPRNGMSLRFLLRFLPFITDDHFGPSFAFSARSRAPPPCGDDIPYALSGAEPSLPSDRPIRSTAPPSTGLVSHTLCPAWPCSLLLRLIAFSEKALSKLIKESRPRAAGLQYSTSQGVRTQQHPIHFRCTPARSHTDNKQQTNSERPLDPMTPSDTCVTSQIFVNPPNRRRTGALSPTSTSQYSDANHAFLSLQCATDLR